MNLPWCGGGTPSWVSWYFKENFNPETLTFNYCQVGQENSFGWEAMETGIIDQFNKLYKMRQENKIELMTLGQLALWYKQNFNYTAATTMTAFTDWNKADAHRTVWYNCKNYRINFFIDRNRFWIRDMHLFNDQYPERYFSEKCLTKEMHFDNLPVIDGNRWSSGNIRAGIYIIEPNGKELRMKDFDVKYIGNTTTIITVNTVDDNKFIFICDENSFNVNGPRGFSLILKAGSVADFSNHREKTLHMIHNNFTYTVNLHSGKFFGADNERQLIIKPYDGEISFDTQKK